MALLAIAFYDTIENGRTEYSIKTLESLAKCNLLNHRIFLIDNDSCHQTKQALLSFQARNSSLDITIITNEKNLGTAGAINKAWAFRNPGENLIKMDNDIVINGSPNWVDDLELALERDPGIGIIGLKRKDLGENPWRTDWLKSEVVMLPHEPGRTWIIVEKVGHVIGSCQMYNHRLIDKIGGLYQMDGLYGFDDSLAAIRCQLAGFYNCFLPHIDIDHIDRGDTPYQKEKEAYASAMMEKYNQTKAAMLSGKMDIYFPIA